MTRAFCSIYRSTYSVQFAQDPELSENLSNVAWLLVDAADASAVRYVKLGDQGIEMELAVDLMSRCILVRTVVVGHGTTQRVVWIECLVELRLYVCLRL